MPEAPCAQDGRRQKRESGRGLQLFALFFLAIHACLLPRSPAEEASPGPRTEAGGHIDVIEDKDAAPSARLEAVGELAAIASESECEDSIDFLKGALLGDDTLMQWAAAEALGIEISSWREKVEFETSDFNEMLVTDSRHSPQATYNGSIYFLWADSDRRPLLAKIDEKSGEFETAHLDPDPGYKVKEDPHNRLSLGIDKDGYIHITGDMHNFPHYISDNIPQRFRDANVMYWISDDPEDISGFTFAGNNPDRTIPGYGFSYHYFFNDNEGKLYFAARVGGFHARAVGLYRYDSERKTWNSKGGINPQHTRTWKDYEPNFLFWVPYGLGDHAYYQSYMTNLRFDCEDRLHFAAVFNATEDSRIDEQTHIAYAYSEDDGESFKRMDGSTIEKLPMGLRPAGRKPDMIVENERLGFTPCAPFFNAEGQPAVSTGKEYWHYDPGEESWEGPVKKPTDRGHIWSVTNYVCPDGIIHFVSGGEQLYRTPGFAAEMPGFLHEIPGGLRSVDDTFFRDSAKLRGVARKNGKMFIRTLTFEQRDPQEIEKDFYRKILSQD